MVGNRDCTTALSNGLFDFVDSNDFIFNGWNPFATLQAGGASGELDVGFLASALGGFQDTIDFDGLSHNANNTDIAQHRKLIIMANVTNVNTAVPEPGTLALLLIAIAGVLLARRRGVTPD